MSEADSANTANTSPVNDSTIRSRPRFPLTRPAWPSVRGRIIASCSWASTRRCRTPP